MSNVVCEVDPLRDGVTVTWWMGRDRFQRYVLDGGSLRRFTRALDKLRGELGNLVVECRAADAESGKTKVLAAALRLAEAGHEVYCRLFEPTAQDPTWRPVAAKIRAWLEELSGADDDLALEILCPTVGFAPWNVLYGQEPDQARFGADDDDAWRPFWGLRYDLSASRRLDPLHRLRFPAQAQTLLVLDERAMRGLDGELERASQLAEAHGCTLVHSKDELNERLAERRPHILYWLCHGTQTGLNIGDHELGIDELYDLLYDDEGMDRSLAFINACGSARELDGQSVLGALFEAGLSGAVATDDLTLNGFAARFGRQFLEGFLERREPIGRLMRDLRRKNLPLGLLYGTYCPPSLRLAHPEPVRRETDHDDFVVVDSGGGFPLQARPSTSDRPLPDLPYPSLSYFTAEHRALFAGRDRDVLRFARLLDDPSARLLVLHGESGVGKSSFLRAGVIPTIEEDLVASGDAGVRAGFRFIRGAGNDEVAVVRATNNLAGQLAQALYDYGRNEHAQPVFERHFGADASTEAIRTALQAEPKTLARVLADLGATLGHTPILIVDQAEELYSLTRGEKDREARRDALTILEWLVRTSGRFKVIIALRTEYFGRLIHDVRAGPFADESIRDFLLTDFDEDQLVEAIVRPTADYCIAHSSEVPRERYGFWFAEGVPHQIARRALVYTRNRLDSVLPLVQVILSQLYARARGRPPTLRRIGMADLEAIGGVAGGMKSHIDEMVRRAFGRDRRAFRRLLSEEPGFYLEHPDGTRTTAIVPEAIAQAQWQGRLPFQAMLRIARKPDKRLLRVGVSKAEQTGHRLLSLGHDALATVCADWRIEARRSRRLRWAGASGGLLVVIALAALVSWLSAEKNYKGAVLARSVAEAQAQTAHAEAVAARDALAQFRAKGDSFTQTRLARYEALGQDFTASYATRFGYAEDFLGPEHTVPLPSIRGGSGDVAPVPTSYDDQREGVLDYHHFSVVMSDSRDIAIYSAANVDGTGEREVARLRQWDDWIEDPRFMLQATRMAEPGQASAEPEVGFDTTSVSLRMRAPMRADPRREVVGERAPPPQLEAPSAWLEYGPLTAPQSVAWGSGSRGTAQAEAESAYFDAFHYTNSAPMHAAFRTGVWAELSGAVRRWAVEHGLRVAVFAGPVLSDEDESVDKVKIPFEYWQIVVWVEGEPIPPIPDVERFRVALSEIDALTGLDFGEVLGAPSRHRRQDTERGGDGGPADAAEPSIRAAAFLVSQAELVDEATTP